MAIIFDIKQRQQFREQLLFHPFWRKVLDWLASCHQDIKVGEYTIDARSGIVATVTEPNLSKLPKHPALAPFEAHTAYIDVHYCLQGFETINHAPITQGVNPQQFDHRDVTLYDYGQHRYSSTLMVPGLVAIFFPGHAHRPHQQSPFSNGPAKQVVIKIPLTALH
jgi:YhcH/YjgK/YiaL family protein